MGKVLAEETLAKSTMIDSASIHAYIEEIGKRIATQLPGAKWDYTLTVIAGDPANSAQVQEPVWIPAGYIFVSSNLILNARSEAEFAGVLAHAMAHSAGRHYTRQATRGQIAKLAAEPLEQMD